MDKAENQINDFEHKQAKTNQSENKKERESKKTKTRIVYTTPGTTSSISTFIS